GTGHHETTALCLAALSELARRRRYTNVLDLGCGTGLLAIGAAKLWNRRVTASDIDPVAVGVTRENAIANGTGPQVHAVTADGLNAPALSAGAPYDLILANILAGPLRKLAPSIATVLSDDGVVILSGLLEMDVAGVVSAYRHQGIALARRSSREGWATLVMKRGGAAARPRRLY
ncbi:MAG: 50S ribosomal protein L11 methyltransferase, partial [Bosea sp.]|nr:50S ribosomal protein L11 methyltransferase [Bosea sp. (in: a-proteobacteria)]